MSTEAAGVEPAASSFPAAAIDQLSITIDRLLGFAGIGGMKIFARRRSGKRSR
jgi:hypothetical protein